MNQEQIGAFIAELRKEKNMTQSTLAQHLGITDRAISKWENGRGMPDLSLLVPLCEILDISINELLSGSRLDKKNYQKKCEDNIIKTITYTDKKIKKTKKYFLTILVTILIFILLFITMFLIDINRMKNNKPVVFSTWGFLYTPAIDIKEEEIEIAITNYLIEQGDNEFKHHNEKAFTSMRIYLLEEVKKDKYYNVYAWVLTEKYYLDSNEIIKESCVSIPYKFIVENIDNQFIVTDFTIPRDGNDYDLDIKNIFPNSVRKYIENVYSDGTIERLELDITQQVKAYFHK